MMLNNAIALVTGGSRGIGRAICQRLAAMGATVGINFVANPQAAEETLALIEADGGKCDRAVGGPMSVRSALHPVRPTLAEVRVGQHGDGDRRPGGATCLRF